MNDVFETIDNNCKTFKERNIFEKDMKDYMNEVFQIFDTGDGKQNQKGKTTGDGSLDKDEWKKMLESGFNLKLTRKMNFGSIRLSIKSNHSKTNIFKYAFNIPKYKIEFVILKF